MLALVIKYQIHKGVTDFFFKNGQHSGTETETLNISLHLECKIFMHNIFV